MAEVGARARAHVYGLPAVRWPEGWPGNSLHANRAAGVHGVPALELGGRLFWADDQLEIAAANA